VKVKVLVKVEVMEGEGKNDVIIWVPLADRHLARKKV
jgi:hypothetical protein